MFKGLDRWLIGIVILVAIVVIVSLALALARSEPEYLADDTPEAVAHNYLLAIQREEYERALGYLSPSLRSLPADSREMRRELGYSADMLQAASFAVQPAEPDSGDVVRVPVMVTGYEGGGILFSDRQSSRHVLWLQPEGATWKLIDGEEFWNRSWH